MKAVWVSKAARVIGEYPVPTFTPTEVLIKNVVVSANPKDYKLPLWMDGYEQIEGNDTAGVVEAVGAEVKHLKKGDRVGAFTEMREKRGGVYAEYSASPSHTTFPLGPKTTFEDAAALPLPFGTAAIGLYQDLGVPATGVAPGTGLLLYGAGTTVGAYVTQLAKKAGLYVVGVAGGTADYVKGLGVDQVIDYRGKKPEEISAAIAAVAKERKLTLVYDAISEDGTTKIISDGYKGIPNVKYAFVLPLKAGEVDAIPSNISHKRITVGSLHTTEKEFGAEVFAKLGPWLESGEIKAHKTKLLPNGLASVEEALDLLQSKRVNGEKLILRIADTPGL